MSAESQMLGKRVLVTGSGTGIGKEIALEFARRGADVALHYAHDVQGAQAAVDQIRALGRRAEAFKANFTQVEEAARLGEQAIAFLGGVDCLVNNAGITFNKPFLEVTREQFDTLYHVNIRAQFFLTQAVVKDMLKHGGGAIGTSPPSTACRARPSIPSMPAPRGRLSPTPARWRWSWPTRGSA